MWSIKLLRRLILHFGLMAIIVALVACNSVGKRTSLSEARQTTTNYANAFDNPQYADVNQGGQISEANITGESNDEMLEQNNNLYDNPQYLNAGVQMPPSDDQQVDAVVDYFDRSDTEHNALEVTGNESIASKSESVHVQTLDERFGINPYLRHPPKITDEVKQAFIDAMILLQGGDDDAGIAALQNLNEEQSLLSGPAYNLAYYYYQKEQTDEAKKYLGITLSRNYNNLDARNLKAKIYRDESDFTAAEKEYLTIIDIWGAYLPAYRNLGILYDLYMGQFAKALNYYQQYRKLNPKEDRQVKGWILVIERKLKARKISQVQQWQESASVAITESATEAVQ